MMDMSEWLVLQQRSLWAHKVDSRGSNQRFQEESGVEDCMDVA